MHITLRRNETIRNFNIWVHGDDKLIDGSGLFVGEGIGRGERIRTSGLLVPNQDAGEEE